MHTLYYLLTGANWAECLANRVYRMFSINIGKNISHLKNCLRSIYSRQNPVGWSSMSSFHFNSRRYVFITFTYLCIFGTTNVNYSFWPDPSAEYRSIFFEKLIHYTEKFWKWNNFVTHYIPCLLSAKQLQVLEKYE